MARTLAQLDAVSSVWLDAIAAVAWQWSLLVLVFAAVAWVLRRSSPSVRYWLWQLVAIKLLVMPLWSWAVPSLKFAAPPPEPARETRVSRNPVSKDPAVSPDAPRGPLRDDANQMANEPPRMAVEPESATVVGPNVSWHIWLFLAWLAGIALQVGLIIRQGFGLASLLRGATPASGELMARVKRLAEQIGLRNVPGVALVELDCSPFVCGALRPILVIPRRFLQTLESNCLDQVILHELAHVRRRDLIWGWIPELARLAYFFHPLIYWVGNRIRLERELACDQLAMLHSGGSAAAYAETLLTVVSQTSEPAALRAAACSARKAHAQRSSGET